MAIQRKYIIAGLIMVGISIPIGFLYLQYRKLMDYALGFNSIKVKLISLTKVNFDLFLNFQNKSSLKFDIIQQDYSVYFNGKFVSNVVNYATNHIAPNSNSVIGVNIQFVPADVIKAIGKDYTQLMANAGAYKISMPMKLKIKLYGITFSFPYTYENTLGGLIKEYKS